MDYIVAKGNYAEIQDAVNEAARRDIRTVVISEGQWQLKKPVCLPDGVTVILWGASLYAAEGAFTNEKRELPYALATEQADIHILGFRGAAIHSEKDYAIAFYNVQHFSIQGISFRGGAGLRLRHARKGTVKQLQLSEALNGVRIEEGCRELILEDIRANTREEAVCWIGGETTVWGRSNEMCQSILCRVSAKTEGAPAVAIRQGDVLAEHLILRDITDETSGDGCSVLVGGGKATAQDITVRNIGSSRLPVQVGETCDGVYVSSQRGKVHPKATRVLCTDSGETPRMSTFAETEDLSWISANDPGYQGTTDAETLQNAINAAGKGVLVIPRHNARTGKCRWELDKTLYLPSGITVVLLDAHLRMQDYTYCNMFASECTENICLLGIGSAVLDSGIPNGLKLKNAGRCGFGLITDNALVALRNVCNTHISGLAIRQSRWYGVYCTGCENVTVRGLDYYAPPVFPDLGGVYIAGGCRNVTVERITGMIGADAVVLDATAQTGAGNIENVQISVMLANVSRCCMVRAFCHDGQTIENVAAECIVGSSLPEQKKQPRAMVCIGQPDGWSVKPVAEGDLKTVLVRDVCGRGASTVELGGKSSGVRIENIHSFGNTGSILRSSPVPEVSEYILSETQETLCTAFRKERTQLTDCTAEGLFFRCLQGSAYMRGTATSIITDKKKFVGTVIDLSGLETEGMQVTNVLALQVGAGIVVTGKAKVTVENLQVELCGRELTLCGPNCTLTADGNPCKVTERIAL